MRGAGVSLIHAPEPILRGRVETKPMTPATLTPPPAPPEASPPAADLRASASPFSARVPLGRPQRREPTGRPTRNAILFSAAVHLLLAAAFVLTPSRREPRLADSGGEGGTLEKVEYLDVGDWPQGGGSASASGTSTLPAEAPAAEAVSAAAADSAAARTAPSAPSATAFPDRVPTRIPGAPAGPGGRPGARPGGAPGAAPAGGAGQGQGQGQGSAIGNNPAGGRLGPGFGDRRLIVRPEAVPERQMSDHERYMRGLADRIETYNDSVADEADRQRRARNWIFKDKNGREWGIAEGGVPVIAGKRIPVPIAPPINVDRDTENRERARTRQREEIDRQADDIERDRVFRERTRAIRERRDRERREREEREKKAEEEGDDTP
jgi:hypothetical protein